MPSIKPTELLTHRIMSAAGMLAILVAVIVMVFPSLAITTSAALIGTAFLVEGIASAIVHVRLRIIGDSSIYSMLYPILELVIGMVLLAQSVAVGEVASWTATLCFIALGTLGIASALAMRNSINTSWSWVLIAGVVSIMCAVLLFLFPVFLASTLTIVTAVHGITLIVFDSAIHR